MKWSDSSMCKQHAVISKQIIKARRSRIFLGQLGQYEGFLLKRMKNLLFCTHLWSSLPLGYSSLEAYQICLALKSPSTMDLVATLSANFVLFLFEIVSLHFWQPLLWEYDLLNNWDSELSNCYRSTFWSNAIETMFYAVMWPLAISLDVTENLAPIVFYHFYFVTIQILG